MKVGEPCRLVLTDGHMPHVDGFTLAEQIKQDAEMGSTVVMMLTSGDRPEDTARCEELGIAAYLLEADQAVGTSRSDPIRLGPVPFRPGDRKKGIADT